MSYRNIILACLIGTSMPVIAENSANNQGNNTKTEVLYGVGKGFTGGLLHRFGTLSSVILLGSCSSAIRNNFCAPDYASDQQRIGSNIAASVIGAGSTRLIDTLLYPTNSTNEQKAAYVGTRIATSLAIASFSFIYPNALLALPGQKYKEQCASNEIGAALSTGVIGGNKIVELDGNKLYIGGIDCSHWINSNHTSE